MSVTLDEERVEKLLSYLDEVGEVLGKIRGLFAGSVQFGSRTPNTNTGGNGPKILDIDVSGIEFKQKQGAKAGPSSKWGWCFGYTQEGEYHPESRVLVQALEQYGKVQVGNRIYSLGGRDGKLLNFKEVGK